MREKIERKNKYHVRIVSSKNFEDPINEANSNPNGPSE